MSLERSGSGRAGRWLAPLAVAALLALPLLRFESSATVRALLDAGHGPLFAAITLLTYAIVRRASGPQARWAGALTALLATLSGVAIEAFQGATGRTPSTRDLVVNLVGTALALAGIRVWRDGGGRRLRAAHAAISLVVLGVLLVPAWREWRAERWREDNFPVLADLEGASQLLLWGPQGGTSTEHNTLLRTDHVAHGGRYALEVRTVAGDWGGAHLDLGRMDWTAYAELELHVYNPGTPFRLRVLVDDENTDDDRKYVRYEELEPGWTEIRIPFETIRTDRRARGLDLSRVSAIRLFAGARQPARVFYLDDIRLNAEPGRSVHP